MPTLLILNGPSLNLLGSREPEIYGRETLDDIHKSLQAAFLQVIFQAFQSNGEGELIDRLHQASGQVDGVIFNPGAYTHTSVALYDAVKAVAPLPVVEVHLSLPEAREDFRRHSFITPACRGRISGFGSHGYHLAVQALLKILEG